MTLTLAEVEHIAQLARLELSADEKARFREQLSAVLDYAARLQQVDTTIMADNEALDPTAPDPRLPTKPRADQVQVGLDKPTALANAPHVENGQFRVPPVLE
jgi:aspartyl-tRNA(Asn)/glutamyl-tRNA(Gln) amidotransferase subunit C